MIWWSSWSKSAPGILTGVCRKKLQHKIEHCRYYISDSLPPYTPTPLVCRSSSWRQSRRLSPRKAPRLAAGSAAGSRRIKWQRSLCGASCSAALRLSFSQTLTLNLSQAHSGSHVFFLSLSLSLALSLSLFLSLPLSRLLFHVALCHSCSPCTDPSLYLSISRSRISLSLSLYIYILIYLYSWLCWSKSIICG